MQQNELFIYDLFNKFHSNSQTLISRRTHVKHKKCHGLSSRLGIRTFMEIVDSYLIRH